MKKLLTILLIGGAATALIGNEEAFIPETYEPIEVFSGNHELNPSVRMHRHQERHYSFTKILGGIDYNYSRPSGLNFGAYAGYSHSNNKSFFLAEWKLKYLFDYSNTLSLYPMLGLSNTSHFSTSASGENFQIYCGKFNGGFGAICNFRDLFDVDFGLHYFKDVTSAVILYKGDDFFGRHYTSPYGFKASLDILIPNIISKDIVIGAFYAQTVKKCYKEFGTKLAVNFVF